MDPKYSDDLHYLWWLAVAIVAGVLVYLLSPILTPFLLAGRISRTFGALPVSAALLGWLRHARAQYMQSELYK